MEEVTFGDAKESRKTAANTRCHVIGARQLTAEHCGTHPELACCGAQRETAHKQLGSCGVDAASWSFAGGQGSLPIGGLTTERERRCRRSLLHRGYFCYWSVYVAGPAMFPFGGLLDVCPWLSPTFALPVLVGLARTIRPRFDVQQRRVGNGACYAAARCFRHVHVTRPRSN